MQLDKALTDAMKEDGYIPTYQELTSFRERLDNCCSIFPESEYIRIRELVNVKMRTALEEVNKLKSLMRRLEG